MFVRSHVEAAILVNQFSHIRRKQILREVEGYLDLLTALGGQWPLRPDNRDRVAQRALDTLDRLDGQSLRSFRALYLKGQALLTMERWRDAVEPLKLAAELDGEDSHVWLALGWCYKRSGRLDLAIQSLEEALAIDPDQAIVHYNLACYWSLARNAKLSVAYLSSAFDIDERYRDLVADEPDFDAIRHHADFLALTSVIV